MQDYLSSAGTSGGLHSNPLHLAQPWVRPGLRALSQRAGNPPRRETAPSPKPHGPAVASMQKNFSLISRSSVLDQLCAQQDAGLYPQACPEPHWHCCWGSACLEHSWTVLLPQVHGGPGGPFLLHILIAVVDMRIRKIILLALAHMPARSNISFLRSWRVSG